MFVTGKWTEDIHVRDFISRNYTPYNGDESFLAQPTENTLRLWDKVKVLKKAEKDAGGVLDVDASVVSTMRRSKGQSCRLVGFDWLKLL